MYGRNPYRGAPTGGFGGAFAGPVPRDVWILLGVVFGTFSLRFFVASAWLPAILQLTPDVWRRAFLWQLVTYPFVGGGMPGLWFLVGLFILFMFSRDVLQRLGRRHFWWLLVVASGVAGVVTVVIALLGVALGRPSQTYAFPLVQGQYMLLTILVAAFATLYRDRTIYLFFVLPIRARWFLGLEILFAFMGFLGTKDLPGFLGICAAVGFTFGHLSGWRGRTGLRDAWLRLNHLWYRLRLAWMKRRRGIRVVRGGDRPGGNGRGDRWIH